MADFGVDTELGFTLKRFSDIQTSLQDLMIQITDPVTGETLQVDFNEDDPLIQQLNSFIDSISASWDTLQSAYNQFDPTNATGPALSGLVQMNGITRKKGVPSVVSQEHFGTPGLIIAAGQEITDINNSVTWVTNETVILDGFGAAIGTLSSKERGAFVAAAGTINKILTPVSGWNATNNTVDSTLGISDETDASLRRRREDATLTPSQSIGESIYSSILNLEGVAFVRVYVNNTLDYDSDGIPPKTLSAVISGGDDDEIAEILFVRIGLGVKTIGNTYKDFVDVQGFNYTMYWYRPIELEVEVEVNLTILDEEIWGTDSALEMKEAIVAYSERGAFGLGIDDGFEEFGFPPGEDIILSQLYTPVNSVPGHKVDSIRIAFVGDPLGTADLPIVWNEVGKFIVANITVNE